MPIDIAVPGDPTAVRTVATWLRATFALAVSSYTDNLTAARTTAGADWDGDASWGFQAVMTTLTQHGVDLDADAQTAATGLDDYAAALETAQEDMAAVRTAATLAGLVVVADQIQDPGPAPAAPRGPVLAGAPSMRKPTPFDKPAVDLAAHEAKVAAYARAQDGTAVIFALFEAAVADLKTIPDATAQRWGLITSSFVSNFVGTVPGVKVRALKARAETLRLDAGHYEEQYLASRNPPERIIYEGLRADAVQTLDDTELLIKETPHSRFARLWAGRIPVVGTAVTFIGIGWDVYSGKDVSTALVGATVGTIVGASVGGVMVSLGAPVVVVAIGATLVVIGASWLAERVWEDVVSEDVKAKVDEGVEWLAEKARAVGSGIGDGAVFIWGLVT